MQTDQQTRAGSELVEQANACLRAGAYSRALDLLRAAVAECPNDAQLAELEKLAQDGIQRNSEAQSLITESQELFAQQKSSEAIGLLRKAYELDKKNALARSILANALAEHAQSLVETDWLEAEKLTNQALAVNPAHPTAKTILHLIVKKKETSPVDDWVAQASKLQSSGDLFGALAWVAEGLAVHPNEARLLQIQEEIQRDQSARRRQTRRRDMDDLRRMELEIKAATDADAKQALAGRIQGIVARYWTDGEILAIANALLLRIGLLGAASSSHKGAPIIFHVPRPSAAKPASAEPKPVSPTVISEDDILESDVSESKPRESQTTPRRSMAGRDIALRNIPAAMVEPQPDASKIQQGEAASSTAAPEKILPAQPEPRLPQAQAATVAPSIEVSAPMTEPMTLSSPLTAEPSPTERSNYKTLIVAGGAAAIILVATTFFLTREHYAAPVAKTGVGASNVSAPNAPEPPVSTANVPAPVPEPTTSESLPVASDTSSGRTAPESTIPDQPAESNRVPITSKGDTQKTSPAANRIRKDKDKEVKLVSSPQPQPRMASLTIQGGAPGTLVLVDQVVIGDVHADGTLSVSTVNPGDHTVELRKEQFKTRLFKEHFVAGEAISLTAADAALESAPAELKITFAPTDANVALVKGNSLALVHSGVPLDLPAGIYTLTTRTADRFTRSSTLEVVAGQSKTLDLALAPNGMSKWENPSAWKPEGESFTHKGGDFVLYGVAHASGTFVFSAMPTKGRVLQWVVNCTDAKNYILFQMDDDNFRRTVMRNGEKRDEIIVPDKGEKKSFRALRIHVSPTEVVHQIRHGNSWAILDRWTQPGTDFSLGKFGFYIPGNDQVELSGFAYYADLNIR